MNIKQLENYMQLGFFHCSSTTINVFPSDCVLYVPKRKILSSQLKLLKEVLANIIHLSIYPRAQREGGKGVDNPHKIF